MDYPDFFSLAPAISVHDGLAELLGACSDGRIEYNYLDAVKLAGHSCPTVAGAYLMTRKALRQLYPDALPERGEIRVSMRNPQDAGVTGVIASIATLITGAAQDGGFKGIAGRFERRNLLFFNASIGAEMEFSRTDNAARIQLSYHPEVVPPDPRSSGLLQVIASGGGSEQTREEFARLWQGRVQRILIDHADDPDLIVVHGG